MSEVKGGPNHNDLDEYETNLIRTKAASVVRRGLVPRSDRDDVQQDLALAVIAAGLHRRTDKANTRGLTYAVVQRAFAKILRGRLCLKRAPTRTSSLDPSHDARDRAPSHEEPIDLASDLAGLLAAMPDESRRLVELLMHQTVTEVARTLGVARSTLDYRVRQLRKRFEEAGLHEFF